MNQIIYFTMIRLIEMDTETRLFTEVIATNMYRLAFHVENGFVKDIIKQLIELVKDSTSLSSTQVNCLIFLNQGS
jgi:hypothetical protein